MLQLHEKVALYNSNQVILIEALMIISEKTL